MLIKLHELKRCPFCGELAEVKQIHMDKTALDAIRDGMWAVGCDGKNGALCPGNIWKFAPFYTTRELAVECWNTRPPLAVLDQEGKDAENR